MCGIKNVVNFPRFLFCKVQVNLSISAILHIFPIQRNENDYDKA